MDDMRAHPANTADCAPAQEKVGEGRRRAVVPFTRIASQRPRVLRWLSLSPAAAAGRHEGDLADPAQGGRASLLRAAPKVVVDRLLGRLSEQTPRPELDLARACKHDWCFAQHVALHEI